MKALSPKSNRPPTRYEKLYRKLRPRDRWLVNEAMIKAVIRLKDSDADGIPGARSFLEKRGEQLIVEMPKIGWSQANKRFRDAVASWVKRHNLTDPLPRVSESVNSSEITQQYQCQKTPILRVEDHGFGGGAT